MIFLFCELEEEGIVIKFAELEWSLETLDLFLTIRW